jgi:hypothetical protein
MVTSLTRKSAIEQDPKMVMKMSMHEKSEDVRAELIKKGRW